MQRAKVVKVDGIVVGVNKYGKVEVLPDDPGSLYELLGELAGEGGRVPLKSTPHGKILTFTAPAHTRGEFLDNVGVRVRAELKATRYSFVSSLRENRGELVEGVKLSAVNFSFPARGTAPPATTTSPHPLRG